MEVTNTRNLLSEQDQTERDASYTEHGKDSFLKKNLVLQSLAALLLSFFVIVTIVKDYGRNYPVQKLEKEHEQGESHSLSKFNKFFDRRQEAERKIS